MRLAEFIRSHREEIIGEWESFARTLQPASDDMSPLALRNHIKQILAFIADDIETPQSGHKQEEKSRGLRPRNLGKGKYSAAETHAALRLAGGFHMDQMVSEYRSLRASITKLWAAEHTEMDDQDFVDQTRFNEAVDQALTESISHYTKMLDHSKDLFLAIMGHDLRNPLGAILTSAQLTLKIGKLDDRQKMLIPQITESASRAKEIVHHLLDLTRARFGSGLPIIAAPMDFGFVSRLMVDEIRAAHPG